MKKLSIDQLRADVAHYFPRSHVEHYRTADQFDNLINFMIAALIGNAEYEFLNEHRFAVVEFIPVTQDTQLILRLS